MLMASLSSVTVIFAKRMIPSLMKGKVASILRTIALGRTYRAG